MPTFSRRSIPITFTAGVLIGVLLGERRRALAALAEERRLRAEREALLSSEREARSAADRASRLKDEFLATVSHELRTPLNAILGWTQILARADPDTAKLEKGLGVIERNARLQIQLISDLLDTSRIVSGKIRLELSTIDLGATVEEVLEGLQATAADCGIALQASLAPCVVVLGDGGRLSQVVSNLVCNALKFTPRGGRVDVSLVRYDLCAELSVADTGEGIAPEFLPSLFSRFRQADVSSTRHHGGLGLGLSIVRHLVELHGGHVYAESPGLGKGARFVVKLPVFVGGPRRAELETAAEPSLETRRLAGVRVLVVDDEPDALELARRILEENAATVTTVASAAEALQAVRASRPDVIVSDIGMPGVDGYELMRRIHEGLAPGDQSPPALALTAFARDEDSARALAAGFQAHLSKPVEPPTLVAAVAGLALRHAA